jgi:hypothetical protein
VSGKIDIFINEQKKLSDRLEVMNKQILENFKQKNNPMNGILKRIQYFYQKNPNENQEMKANYSIDTFSSLL